LCFDSGKKVAVIIIEIIMMNTSLLVLILLFFLANSQSLIEIIFGGCTYTENISTNR